MSKSLKVLLHVCTIMAVLATVVVFAPARVSAQSPYSSALIDGAAPGDEAAICTHTFCSNCPKWSRNTKCKFDAAGNCKTVHC